MDAGRWDVAPPSGDVSVFYSANYTRDARSLSHLIVVLFLHLKWIIITQI